MSTSETPRTDEEVEIAKKFPLTNHGLWVSAEFCRQLERELEQERDIRSTREITLSLVADGLGVEHEPHQTFDERLLEASCTPRSETAPKRREGHSALRAKDGKLEVFDPHPPQQDIVDAAKEWIQGVQVMPVLPPNAEEGFRAGAAWARSAILPNDSTSIPSQRLASSEARPGTTPDEPVNGETHQRRVAPRSGSGEGVSQADRGESPPSLSSPDKPLPTPRTEAMIESCGDYEKAYHYNGRFAEFARGLERELAASEHDRAALHRACEGYRKIVDGAAPSSIAPTDAVRDALIDLVRLKDLKQWIESDIPDRWTGHKPAHWERVQQYEREKEPAWEAARLALERAPSATAPIWKQVTMHERAFHTPPKSHVERDDDGVRVYAKNSAGMWFKAELPNVPTDGGAKTNVE